MNRNSLRAFIMAMLLLLPIGIFAQSTAVISGTVTDESGAVVPSADVTVSNVGTGQTRTVKTNETGRYYAAALNPGSYQITAATQGFEQTVRSGITLNVGSEMVVNLTLKPGQVTEKIEVAGEMPLVQTTSASVSELVDSQKIRALPLNGRSFDQLIYLQPGVNVATGAGTGANQGRGTKFSANGARLTSNYFMLDGTDLNDSQNFTPGSAGGQLLGVESIQEFQVLTHNPGAQYGRSMGGIINAVTRSGTNTFHGSLYEFLRNSKLDAKNFFDNPREPIPAFKRNQFGATAGGPLRRDRLFLFGNYEGFRERLGVSKLALVPDQNARQGILPGRAPITVNPAVIPYVALWPLPNVASPPPNLAQAGIGQYRFSQSQPTRADYGTARLDWVVREQDSVFGRYTMDDSDKLRLEDPNHVLGLFGEAENHRNQYVTLQWTRTLSSTVLNAARFGFNRSVSLVDLQKLGSFPDSLSFIAGRPLGRMGIPGMSACCATTNDPRLFRMNSFQPSDDVSITMGHHALKIGFNLERFQWNTENWNRFNGDYNFDSLESFLLGRVLSVDFPLPGSEPNRGIRATLLGTYLQDDYQVTPRLTLNLGMRYEITTVPTEVNGKLSFLDDPTDITLEKKQPFDGNHLNFAPRFGFAWDVTGNGKTSIRGGWGIYYDQILMNQFLNLFDRSAPFWRTARLGAGAPFPHPLDSPNAQESVAAQVSVRNDFKTPYMYQYNVTVQRQIGPSLVASVGYVGSIGKHLIQRFDGNTPMPTRLADGSLFTEAGARRRNPVWPGMQTRRLAGFSTYSGLQISVNRRFSRGLQVQGIYTLARSIDTSSGLFSEEAQNAATGAQIPDKLFNEKALSNFDIRQIAVINFNYELPFGKNLAGVARQVVAGWEIGGISTLSAGVPVTVENAGNRSRNLAAGADFADRPDLAPGASNNPNHGTTAGCQFGTSRIAAGQKLGTPELWFDPCAFAPQPLGFFGNLGRNTVIGPGIATIDLLINKHFRIREGRELSFRAELFNVANRANLAPPFLATRRIFDTNGRLTGSAGAITQTTSTSRQIQFGLKYTF